MVVWIRTTGICRIKHLYSTENCINCPVGSMIDESVLKQFTCLKYSLNWWQIIFEYKYLDRWLNVRLTVFWMQHNFDMIVILSLVFQSYMWKTPSQPIHKAFRYQSNSSVCFSKQAFKCLSQQPKCSALHFVKFGAYFGNIAWVYL